uniref:Uncharacterized protein n=1 Tax=Megaselia scalaris TaxID=36166 RepID=T1H4Q7_MEGSC
MMTESMNAANHLNNGTPKGVNHEKSVVKGTPTDDMGWKAKLKIPPKDNRPKTS